MRNPFKRRTPETEVRAIEESNFAPPSNWAGARVSPFVNADTALRLAPVYGAARVLASNIASLPVHQYRKRSDDRQPVKLSQLFTKPSATGDLRDWVFRAVTSLVLRGNAVGVITSRDKLEYPTSIEWLNPDDVRVEDNAMFGPGSFTSPTWYWNGVQIPAADIVHIPWFTVAGRVWGLSPLGAYAASVHTGLAAHQYKADWFEGGGVPPGTFRNTQRTINQSDAAEIKNRLVQSVKSHEPIVYGVDWEYSALSVDANEAQFIETLQMTANDVATVYGVPPEMIGGSTGDSMTYSNAEQHNTQFVKFTLMPWLTTLESHLSALLPRGQEVKFNVDAFVRPDTQTRYSVYRTAIEIGLMSINECRALEDLPPVEGGDEITPKSTGEPAPEPESPAPPEANGTDDG